MSERIDGAARANTAEPSGPAINLPDFDTDLVSRRANKLINNLLAEYTHYIRFLDEPINNDLKSAVDEFITTRRLPPQELLKISSAALKILNKRNDIPNQQKKGISEALQYFQDKIQLTKRINLQSLSSQPIPLTEQEEIFIGGIYRLFHRTDKNLGKLFLSNLGKLEDPISKITDYDLETTLNVILITADQYFRSKEKSANFLIKVAEEGFFPKQAENHQYLNLPGKITAESGSNIMDKSLGITLRRDFAEKLEELLKAYFSNLNQAQIPLTENDADSQSPGQSLPDLSTPPYTLKPFYEPSQADDQRVANPTNSGTPKAGSRSIFQAILSNDAGAALGEPSEKNAPPQKMSRKQISEWIKELELQTPLLPYLRTACLNAATAKTQLS
jgi:hypothetical protein